MPELNIDQNLIFYFVIFFLTIIQSIAGVGILVIGTPTLIILNIDLVNAINILLPLSIVVSFINLIVMNNNKEKKVFFDKNFKYFFLTCIPGIILGIYILKNYNQYFNFEYLISFIICISILLKLKLKNQLLKVKKIKKKVIIFLIGIIHGITNSGGTLLSLFISSLSNNIKNIRKEITFFYFLLATFQYLIFLYYFKLTFSFKNFFILIPLIFGIILGNILFKKINFNLFNIIINILAFFSALVLLFKSVS